MKFKISKKIVSLFLAVMMVVTSVPAFAINASAAENSKYLFAYFTGNATSEQKIHFATSTDGRRFTALNGGNQTVTQKTGTQCARDPYLFYSEKENCYYLLATDYDYSHDNWGDNQSTMTVWKSNDLITWSNETHIDAKNIPGINFVNNLWAPQALWDDNEQKYMVYYSTTLDGDKTVVYSYTTDLFDVTKYSAPQKISNFSFPIIDADITKVGDEYVMFVKYEGKSTIYASVSNSPNSFSNPVKLVSTNASTAFEGPQLFKTTTGYSLTFDNFNNNGNVWIHEFTNEQFASFVSQVKAASSSQISIANNYSTTINPTNDGISARHGSFISISDEQYNALQNAQFNVSAPSEEGVTEFGVNSSNLIARYLVNDATTDTTGKNSALANNNSVSWDSAQGAAQFSMNNKSYLSLNTSMLSGTTANGFTVSLYAKPSSSNTTPDIYNMQGRFFEFTTNTPLNGSSWDQRDNYTYFSTAHNGIVQVNDKNYNNHIAADPGSSNKYYNDWHLYTVSVSSSGITVYIDGVKSASTGYTGAVTYEGFINNLASCNLLIGASGWNDATYDGYMKDFRVYNKAITDDEATKLPTQYELDTAPDKQQYVLNNIGKTKSYTFDTKIANADDNYMKNIVYSGAWGDSSWTTINNYSDSSRNSQHFKVMGPSVAVGVYSGPGTDIRFPLISQTQKDDNRPLVTNYIGIDHVAYNDGTFNVGGANWERCSGWNNLTSNSDTGHNFSSDPNGGIDRKTKSDDKKFQLNNDKTWKNYMTYKGSGNESTYYDLLTNPSFAYQADYSWKYTGGWGDNSNYTCNVGATNQKFYVINYAPLKAILESSAFKLNFQNVVDNKWMYDESSYAKYIVMYYNMITFDLTKCDYSTDSDVQNVATQIKNFVDNYKAAPELKKINVEFTFTNGTFKTETITAGTSLAGLIPNNTTPKSNENGTHSVYTWSDKCSESTVPQNDVTYHETFTDVDCTYDEGTTVDGVTTKKCTVCGYVKTEINLNYDAYNAAVAVAQAAIENTAKYTETSRNELQSVLNNNKLENAKSQSELEVMTKAIIEATNDLVLNTYTVKFYKVINNGDPELVNECSGKYGKDVTLESGLDDSYAITKWTKTVGETDEKVGSSNTTLLTRYYANVNYYVYASKAESKGDNSAIVALTDRTGRVVDNMYVDLVDGKATVTVKADVANKTVTVEGTPLKAIDLTFYTINGFKIGDTVLQDGVETQVDITKDLTISTVYGNSKSFNITSSDGSCHPSVSEAFWDQKVTVTADNTTANTKWIVNDVVVAYGTEYVFRATKDVDIKCVTDSSVAKATATIENLSYHSPIANTITVVGSFNLPEGCTLVSQGALLKTTSSDTTNSKAAVNNIDNYTGANANARKFIAYNYSKDANQYMITFYASKYYPSLYIGAVAFVTYRDAGGVEHTEYSDLVTYTHGNA